MVPRDVRRRIARVSLLALGGSAACSGVRLAHPSAAQAMLAQPMSTQAMPARLLAGGTVHDDAAPALQVASDEASASIPSGDDAQLAAALNTIVGKRTTSVTLDRTEGVSRVLFNKPPTNAGSERPLFVIDGVPLADDYTVKIQVPNIARIDLLTDSLVTHAYGVRGTRAVVLVTLRSR